MKSVTQVHNICLSSVRLVNSIHWTGMGSHAKRVSLVLCLLDRPQGGTARRNRFICAWRFHDLHHCQDPVRCGFWLGAVFWEEEEGVRCVWGVCAVPQCYDVLLLKI